MKTSAKNQQNSLIPGNALAFRRRRKKLPQFQPQDFDSIMRKAKQQGTSDPDAVFFELWRQLNDQQMTELTNALGVEPSDPDRWKKATFHLAYYHHGIGHLAYSSGAPRRRMEWSPSGDYALLKEVTIEMAKGFSERQAVKNIAADKKRRALLPYHEQRQLSKANETARRAAALRKRLQKIMRDARTRPFLHRALGLDLSLTALERSVVGRHLSTLVPHSRGEN